MLQKRKVLRKHLSVRPLRRRDLQKLRDVIRSIVITGASQMAGANPLDSASQFGMMAKRAMQLGNHPEALNLLSMGLHQLRSLNCPPHYAAPFLMDQAECFWQIRNIHAALQHMGEAIKHGLANDGFFAEVINILDIV